MSDTVKLTYKNQDFIFPLVEGSEKEKGIDIKTLRSKTGLITYDPGYKIQVLVKVKLLFLMVKMVFYVIDTLLGSFEKASFLEVNMLIFGDMPKLMN